MLTAGDYHSQDSGAAQGPATEDGSRGGKRSRWGCSWPLKRNGTARAFLWLEPQRFMLSSRVRHGGTRRLSLPRGVWKQTGDARSRPRSTKNWWLPGGDGGSGGGAAAADEPVAGVRTAAGGGGHTRERGDPVRTWTAALCTRSWSHTARRPSFQEKGNHGGRWLAPAVDSATRSWGHEFDPHVGQEAYLKKKVKTNKKKTKR